MKARLNTTFPPFDKVVLNNSLLFISLKNIMNYVMTHKGKWASKCISGPGIKALLYTKILWSDTVNFLSLSLDCVHFLTIPPLIREKVEHFCHFSCCQLNVVIVYWDYLPLLTMMTFLPLNDYGQITFGRLPRLALIVLQSKPSIHTTYQSNF